MQRRPLGDTELEVSEISFGAMTFGSGMGTIAKVDASAADRMVGLAVDAGVNLFDTANVYAAGQSEEMLGRALGSRRKDVLIATKAGFGTGLSREDVISAAEASLQRLGTDWIDLYQLHRPDPNTPFEETAEALDELVRRGSVRHVGFSNYPAWMAALSLGVQRARELVPFCCAQMYYSLLGRDLEVEILPFLESAGLGLVVWSPLASGYLTGKYSEGASARGDAGRREGMAYPPIDPDMGAAVLAEIGRIGGERDAAPAQVALAWVLQRARVTTVIVGASSEAQLRENLAATELRLSDAEIGRLDALTEPRMPYPRWPMYEDGAPNATAERARM